MIKTLKQTISNIYYWIKKKLIQFKKWLIILIFGAAVVAAPLVIPPQVPDVALEKIQQKYETSELKGKYRLEKTAFILDAVDENAIQAEVGNKNSDEFTPELTLRKWDDEVNFKVKYKHSSKKNKQKVDIEGKKIKWKGEKTEVHYYDIKKGELLHDKVLESDVYEVEVILLEKPDTNIVSFDIETKGLKFYYQPELTQKEKDEGASRPENVVGSYAVYHESKAGDYSPMGLKNYRAGKAFHIYRPKIIDSAGTEVWGKLNITDNLLTVEIPQEFLDNAVYPVRHAAGLTFGYYNEGTPGGSTWGTTADYIVGTKAIPASAGTATSISFYLVSDSDDDGPRKLGLYKMSDNSFVKGTAEHSRETPDSWHTHDLTESVAITTTEYTIVHYGEELSLAYDSVVNAGAYWNGADYPAAFPNPINWSSTSYDRKFSIYCTYTAEEAERRMFLIE